MEELAVPQSAQKDWAKSVERAAPRVRETEMGSEWVAGNIPDSCVGGIDQLARHRRG